MKGRKMDSDDKLRAIGVVALCFMVSVIALAVTYAETHAPQKATPCDCK